MIDKVLGRFLLPEKDVSLKLVFDNARNYVIVAGFVAMARWFEAGKATPVPYVFSGPPKTGWGELMWLSLGIGVVLFLLNLGQSYLIVKRLVKAVLGIESSDSGKQTAKTWPWYVGLVVWVLAALFSLSIIAASMLLLNFAFYMVWYAAAGAGR